MDLRYTSASEECCTDDPTDGPSLEDNCDAVCCPEGEGYRQRHVSCPRAGKEPAIQLHKDAPPPDLWRVDGGAHAVSAGKTQKLLSMRTRRSRGQRLNLRVRASGPKRIKLQGSISGSDNRSVLQLAIACNPPSEDIVGPALVQHDERDEDCGDDCHHLKCVGAGGGVVDRQTPLGVEA